MQGCVTACNNLLCNFVQNLFMSERSSVKSADNRVEVFLQSCLVIKGYRVYFLRQQSIAQQLLTSPPAMLEHMVYQKLIVTVLHTLSLSLTHFFSKSSCPFRPHSTDDTRVHVCVSLCVLCVCIQIHLWKWVCIIHFSTGNSSWFESWLEHISWSFEPLHNSLWYEQQEVSYFSSQCNCLSLYKIHKGSLSKYNQKWLDVKFIYIKQKL